MSYVTTAKF